MITIEEWIATQNQVSFALVLSSSILAVLRPVNSTFWKWLNSDMCRAIILLIVVLVVRPGTVENNVMGVLFLLTYSALATSLPEEGFTVVTNKKASQPEQVEHQPLSDRQVAAGSSTSCRKRSIIDEELHRASENESVPQESRTEYPTAVNHYESPSPLFSTAESGGADFDSSFASPLPNDSFGPLT